MRLSKKLKDEWDYTKNEKKPDDFSKFSNKKAWWKCKKGHEWEAIIGNRTKGTNCPYCAGKFVSKDNTLFKANKSLVKEWHPKLNNELTPLDVTKSSSKRVWWKCKIGHEWKTSIASRTSKLSGCPYCKSQTSILELRLYAELSIIFKNIKHRFKINKIECDIYIQDYKIAIEVDGNYWHKNKYSEDSSKNERLKSLGITCLRVRGAGLDKITSLDILISKQSEISPSKKIVNDLLMMIVENYKISEEKEIFNYLKKDDFQNVSHFNKLISNKHLTSEDRLLKNLLPHLEKEFDKNKNDNLSFDNLIFSSRLIVWWVCKNGHSWKEKVSNRSFNNADCPFCSGRSASKIKNLYTQFPEICKEWNEVKNFKHPEDITPNSNKKYWWKCKKGHEWEASPNTRVRGRGCPYCKGSKITLERSILKKFKKEIINEWNIEKNIPFSIGNVFASSDKKFWWKCKNGHEWRASPNHRLRGTSCPFCAGRKLTHENSLHFKNKKISNEWHPIKNGNLTSKDVFSSSGKKYWWKCKIGHEWEASPNNRSKGNGCPYCSGKKIKLL